MSKAIRGHNLGATVAMALIVGLLLLVGLVFAVHQATVTSDQAGTPAISSDGQGGPDLSRDPYIERHAEVVARYHQNGRR
jgi:hypothetical protein